MDPIILSSSSAAFILYGTLILQATICVAVFFFSYKFSRRSLRSPAAIVIGALSAAIIFILATLFIIAFRIFAYDIMLIGNSAHKTLPQGSYVVVRQLVDNSMLSYGAYVITRQPNDRAYRIAAIVALPADRYHQNEQTIILCQRTPTAPCESTVPSDAYIVSHHSPFDTEGRFAIISSDQIQGTLVMKKR